jgi:hypothetical protein
MPHPPSERSCCNESVDPATAMFTVARAHSPSWVSAACRLLLRPRGLFAADCRRRCMLRALPVYEGWRGCGLPALRRALRARVERAHLACDGDRRGR